MAAHNLTIAIDLIKQAEAHLNATPPDFSGEESPAFRQARKYSWCAAQMDLASVSLKCAVQQLEKFQAPAESAANTVGFGTLNPIFAAIFEPFFTHTN